MHPIHFAHSNGFSAKTYRYFLQQLHPYPVEALDCFGHTPLRTTDFDWKNFAAELISDIENKHQQPVVGVGHSLGAAVIFFAAHQRPDLFRHVILLEPPMFSFRKRMLIFFSKMVGLVDKFGPSGRAKNRRRLFADRQEAYQYFRNKSLFKPFDENCFNDYIEYGLESHPDGGLRLAFSPLLEYRIFQNPPIFFTQKNFKMPADFVYSNRYQTLEKPDVAWWKQHFPSISFYEFDGGHMFPLEKPMEAAVLIKNLISKNEEPV